MNLENTYRKNKAMTFEELISFRTMYLTETTQQFIDNKQVIPNYFRKYKGELLIEYTHRQKDYLDFLISMKELGFTRDEVDDYILSHAEVTEL